MKMCRRCGGQKEVHDGGYMLVKCPVCNGLGEVKEEEKISVKGNASSTRKVANDKKDSSQK